MIQRYFAARSDPANLAYYRFVVHHCSRFAGPLLRRLQLWAYRMEVRREKLAIRKK